MSPFHCNIELESVSANVRADIILNKVYSFLEKELLVLLRTVSLIHLYGFYVYVFLQNIRKAIR